MLSISKEDAEFLAGFIDQWLPVCGEKTAERARAVRECLTADPKASAPIVDAINTVIEARGRCDLRLTGGDSGIVANVILTGMPEPIYDGKALIAAIDGAIANGARINVPEYDLSDLAVSPITDDDEDADDYFCPCCVPDSEDDGQ